MQALSLSSINTSRMELYGEEKGHPDGGMTISIVDGVLQKV